MARKKKPEEHVNHERWLVSYADFITLLFAFFTTLYALSKADAVKVGKMVYSMRSAFHMELFQTPEAVMAYQGMATPAVTMEGDPGVGSEGGSKQQNGDPDIEEDIGKIAKDLKELIADPGLKDAISVKVDDRGVVVSLAEAGFFGSGVAEMSDEKALKALETIVGKLQKDDVNLSIEGHTDNRPVRGGKYKDNWALSSERGSFILRYAAEHGIDPSRLRVSGYGDTKPVGDNATEEGRAKNRRVDIIIAMNPKAKAAAPEATPVKSEEKKHEEAPAHGNH